MDESQLLTREKNKLKSLSNQRELLYSLQKHHLLWADLTNEDEVKLFHLHIANLINETITEMDALLNTLDATGEEI